MRKICIENVLFYLLKPFSNSNAKTSMGFWVVGVIRFSVDKVTPYTRK